jgi:hypothetical protein
MTHTTDLCVPFIKENDTILPLVALPHGKSSFVRFKHLLSSDSALVCPLRPHRRSPALEREKNLASVRENEEDIS